jgi:uncharacterized protein (DUF2267 family)
MRYERFIKEVKRRAHLSSQSDAVAAVRATLMTLAERLTADECEDLAAQLTHEIAFYVREGSLNVGPKLSYDDFVERIANRAEVPIPQAVFRARVVLEVLSEAVSKGEMNDVRAQLPRDFAPLFSGSEGKAPAP